MMPPALEVPQARLIYSRSVETVVGVREVQLYWGALLDVIGEDSCVLVSSNLFAERRARTSPDQPLRPEGAVWRSLDAKFGLSEQPLLPVIQAHRGSSVWPTSATLEARVAEAGEGMRPHIDCVKMERGKAGDPGQCLRAPRAIFCLHTLSFDQSRQDPEAEPMDYRYALGACLAAIRAQEAADLVRGETHEAYSEVVMSALAAKQSSDPHVLLKRLLDHVSRWFEVSPKLKTIKVCYWDPNTEVALRKQLLREGRAGDIHSGDKIREDLLELLGERAYAVSELERKSREILLQEFEEELEGFRQHPVFELGSELETAIDHMLVILQRPDPTMIEVGNGAGRLAEGLVNHLCVQFYGKRPGTFHSGIEKLATQNPTADQFRGRRISSWYKSYLHTLRVLRNTTAHSQDVPEGQYPPKLDMADTWVLVVSLRRVLSLHRRLFEQERTEP